MKRLLRKKAGTPPAPSGAKAECLLSLQIQFRFCLQGLDTVKQLLACFHSVLAAKGHTGGVCHPVCKVCGLCPDRFSCHAAHGLAVRGQHGIGDAAEVPAVQLLGLGDQIVEIGGLQSEIAAGNTAVIVKD